MSQFDWKWFDLTLTLGILTLSMTDYIQVPLYHGCKKTFFDELISENNMHEKQKKKVIQGAFVHYFSTSTSKIVAINWLQKEKGIIFKIDPKLFKWKRGNCCDISWISVNPQEEEVLFARKIAKIASGYVSEASLAKILSRKAIATLCFLNLDMH